MSLPAHRLPTERGKRGARKARKAHPLPRYRATAHPALRMRVLAIAYEETGDAALRRSACQVLEALSRRGNQAVST